MTARAPAVPGAAHVERHGLVRRGLRLNYATIGYNALEAVVAVAAGLVAGSVALVSFGLDSAIEVTAAGAAQWRLRADLTHERRERVERITVRIIGWSFLVLAAYVLVESVATLSRRERPERSVVGAAILAASVVVMPVLARAKRRVAVSLGSRALAADATQTSLCAYLSAIGLAGVALNAWLGWWWADPAAALAMVPIIAKEGLEGIRGEDHCQDCRRPEQEAHMTTRTTETTGASAASGQAATVRPARPDDLPRVEALLRSSDLPVDGVAEALSTFVVAEHDGRLVGVAGLECCRENALLRSVAVDPEWRSRGLGRQLVTRVISEAEARGIRALYLLTMTAEHYFPSFGFAKVSRDAVPADVRGTGEFQSACPASATVMARPLAASASPT